MIRTGLFGGYQLVIHCVVRMHPYLQFDRQQDSVSSGHVRSGRLQRRTDFAAQFRQICSQFSHATGWTLSFEQADIRSASEIEEQLRDDADCRWFAPIGSQNYVDGFLRLDGSVSRMAHTDLSQARELAEIVRQLCTQVRGTSMALESRTESVLSLLDTIRETTEVTDASTIVRDVLDAVVELTDFCTAAFFMLSTDGNRLLMRSTYGIRLGELSTTCRNISDGPPDLQALTQGAASAWRSHTVEDNDWLPPSAQTGYCRRVETTRGPIGTIWGYDRRHRKPDALERRVMESLATLAASLLERCALQQQATEQKRVCLDVKTARSNESRSRSLPITIEDPRVDVATFTSACDELSGDLVDIIPIDDDQFLLLIGDATGHSVPAAMIMASVRAAVRALVRNGHVPASETDILMQHVNRTWYDIAPSGSFMSLFAALVDSSIGTVTYSNAGHPRPFRFRAGQSTLLDGHGLLLGIDPDVEYPRQLMTCEPGDQLVIFTDGISECFNDKLEMFRYDGMMSAMTSSETAAAQETIEEILFRLEQHSGGNYKDDRTLAVLRFPTLRVGEACTFAQD